MCTRGRVHRMFGGPEIVAIVSPAPASFSAPATSRQNPLPSTLPVLPEFGKCADCHRGRADLHLVPGVVRNPQVPSLQALDVHLPAAARAVFRPPASVPSTHDCQTINAERKNHLAAGTAMNTSCSVTSVEASVTSDRPMFPVGSSFALEGFVESGDAWFG